MALVGALAPIVLTQIIGPIVKSVLHRDDVPIENSKVPEVTNKVMEAVAKGMAAEKVAVVPVTSPLKSKINWTQFAGVGVALLALIGLKGISEEQLVAILIGVQAVQSVVTIIIRTYFTKGVTAASVTKG